MVKSEGKINPRLLKHILTLRYSPTIKTKIQKLNWKNFVEKPSNISTDFIEQTITNNIKNHIDNSNKISIALSGGIDSTLVLNFLRKTVPDATIKAISVKFAESLDETNNAANIANKFDIKHEIIFLENFLKELPKAISIVKFPFWDIHWYYIAKKASLSSKFIVSGDGGDELFGGYTFRYKKFLSLIQKNSSIEQKIISYLQCHERDWVPDQEKIFNKKAAFSWKEIHNIFKPYFDNPLTPLEQVFLADFNGKLRYNFSIISNSLNSHFKIKPVTPLLSQEMITYATHIPLSSKYDTKRNLGKILLRQILYEEGLKHFISKNKQGFSVDTKNLWKSYGYDLCDYYLSDARIVKEGWINLDWIQKHFQKNLDVRYVNKFLGLLALEIWYRLFITKEMKPTTSLS